MNGHQKRLEFGAPNGEVVAKANDLVRAQHTFSTVEQRIFVSMIARLDPRNTREFPMQKVRIKDVCELSDTDPSNVYRKIDDITHNLLENVIKIPERNEEGEETAFRRHTLFTTCRYEKGSGVLYAKFNEEISDLLLELKERYTLYLVTVFLRLRSKYSTRIYEHLKMRQGLRRYEISVEKFRETLSVQDKYPVFAHLEKRVIEQARTELKEKADIYFTYRVHRENNSPESIEFFIHDNDPVIQDIKESDNSLPDENSGHTGDLLADKEEETGRQKGSSKPPSVDARALFLQDRTQEELQALGREDVETLYAEAERHVTREEPEASETFKKSLIRSRMENLWQEGWHHKG